MFSGLYTITLVTILLVGCISSVKSTGPLPIPPAPSTGLIPTTPTALTPRTPTPLTPSTPTPPTPITAPATPTPEEWVAACYQDTTVIGDESSQWYYDWSGGFYFGPSETNKLSLEYDEGADCVDGYFCYKIFWQGHNSRKKLCFDKDTKQQDDCRRTSYQAFALIFYPENGLTSFCVTDYSSSVWCITANAHEYNKLILSPADVSAPTSADLWNTCVNYLPCDNGKFCIDSSCLLYNSGWQLTPSFSAATTIWLWPDGLNLEGFSIWVNGSDTDPALCFDSSGVDPACTEDDWTWYYIASVPATEYTTLMNVIALDGSGTSYYLTVNSGQLQMMAGTSPTPWTLTCSDIPLPSPTPAPVVPDDDDDDGHGGGHNKPGVSWFFGLLLWFFGLFRFFG